MNPITYAQLRRESESESIFIDVSWVHNVVLYVVVLCITNNGSNNEYMTRGPAAPWSCEHAPDGEVILIYRT